MPADGDYFKNIDLREVEYYRNERISMKTVMLTSAIVHRRDL
jgi:hypothetical protein